jgi:protein TonB
VSNSRKQDGKKRPAVDDGAQEPMFGNLLASQPKRGLGKSVPGSLFSVAFHGAVGASLVMATINSGTSEEEEEEITFIEIPESTPPPPPPPPEVDVPAPPPVGFTVLTAPTIVPPDIPPPNFEFRLTDADFSGIGVAQMATLAATADTLGQRDIAAAPTFTPYETAPELRNRAQVGAALQREYPPLLRDSGIGGTVLMWFFINDEGITEQVQVNSSSGYPQLDEAAMRVASIFEFTPALNRAERVPVWVAIPITFETITQ